MNVLKVVPLVVVALLAVGCRSVATGGPGIAAGTAMATTSRGSSTPSPSKGTSAPTPAHGTSTPVQSTSVPTASASTSAPTPVITTPTPAPVTATATPAPGVSSSSAAPSPSTSFAWCSSAPFGTESTSDGFLLYNNEWNTAAAGPQTICGNSGASWQVTSTQGGPDATSVKTYPSVQKNYPDEPVGQFTSMTSSYAESMPSTGDFEAAYDIWLNKLSKEVMFWVDNHGQTPAGTKQGTVTLGGLTWTLYATGGGYWAFVLDHNASSGTVDLAAGLRYLESTGALSASDQLWQVNFGWEICSTQNQPEVFRMTNYSLASS